MLLLQLTKQLEALGYYYVDNITNCPDDTLSEQYKLAISIVNK